MYYYKNDENYRQMLDGIRYKTLVHGDRTSLSEFHLSQDHVIPEHAHPHEQTGYMISGRMIFYIGDKKHEAMPGNSWCIPANVKHSVEVLEDSVVIEVFSPVREEYL
jgi:quercetin dioxygenase-like cupin family protein